MKIKKIVMAAICVLSVVNCACNGQNKNGKPNSPNSFYGTFLFINPCSTYLEAPPETRGVETAIAAALASGIVKTGIDWIGAALQRAAQDDVDKTIVSLNLTSISQVFNPDQNICLQVVRGEFRYAENITNGYTNSFSVSPNSVIVTPLQLVEGTEELFIEILPIIHDNVISFTPLEVRYSGYTPSDRRTKKPRDLALFVGCASPATDVSAGEYPGRLINFGTLTPIDDKQATIKYVTNGGRVLLVNQTQWLGIPNNDKDQPLTFAANVIETRKANQFSKFLDDVFEASKEDIKTAVSTAVKELEFFKTSKELRDFEIAKLKSEQTYYDAMLTVRSKEVALTKLCDSENPLESKIYNAQKELFSAQMEANIAAVSSGTSRPYSKFEIKSPNGKCNDN